jgi:diguanylate cyclase (GGDEF)-like protein/PAS domain S-box-containing protein
VRAHPNGVVSQAIGGVYFTIAEGGPPALAVAGRTAARRISWANDAALALLGLTPEEVIGAELAQLDAPVLDGVAHWTVVVDELIEQERAGWTDAIVEGPGRSMWPIQLLVRPVHDDVYAVWLRSTSADLRLAEAAQRESEHRFQALAEHAPVGIVVSEAGLRLGFANARFGQIVGLDPALVTGIRWLKTVHPEDLPVLLGAVDEVLAGSSRELNVRLVRYSETANEPARWVQIRLAPVTTPRRSAGFIGTIEDVTDRRAWENQLSYIAGHDALTGLANRRNLVEAITQLLTSRRTRDRDAAVLFCDLDGFKQVNDTLGHEAGDRVLIEVGQRLVTTARDHDLVARIAGDEFVVLIREIGTVEDAEIAAARQLQALISPIFVAGTSVVVSASIGVAMARDFSNASELLQAADRGMYEAKRAGRGRYRRGNPHE